MSMMGGRRIGTGIVAALVVVASVGAGTGAGAAPPAAPDDATAAIPGPIARGFSGPAYPVPTGSDPAHRDAVRVAVQDASGKAVGTDYAPAGTAVMVRPAPGHPDQVVVALRPGVTARAPRARFWSMPTFIQLGDVEVPVNGTEVPLARSGVRYHRGSVTTFTNGSKGFDGLIPTNREFLECKRDTWGMGGQTFAVDVVEDGVHRQDRTLLDLGLRAIDWGVAVPINGKGIHELHRRCDGKTVADFGYTHHTTQWLESLSRTTYLLASSPWAGEYRAKIDAYRRRIATIANLLMKPDVKSFWVAHVRDGFGNDFTHRTFMRAAAMGMASTLATRPSDAKRWAADAKAIARRGIHNQLPSGVNPERGGFDVLYQMYGTWLAELYEGTLAGSDPMKQRMDRTIDKATHWMLTRIDPATGRFKIRGTTRICVEDLWTGHGPAPFVDPAETIRGFLLWGHLHDEPELTAAALLADRGFKRFGNTCPRNTHTPPERQH